MNPIEKVHDLLSVLAPRGAPLASDPELHTDEARWFLGGIDAGLWSFTTCPDECPRARRWGTSGPDHFTTPAGAGRHLFSDPTATAAWLNREYVPHLAAYARAILDFGHDPTRASLSRYRTYSRDLLSKRAGGSYETDAEFHDAGGHLLLQVEAKADPRQTDQLAEQIRTHRLADLHEKHAKEVEYVLDLAPRLLWVAGPASIEPATHVFAVHVDGLDATFTAVDERSLQA